MKVMMKKMLAVMLVLMACACAEGVMLFEIPGRNTDNASTFELEDGLSVELCGIVRDLDAEGDIRECVFTLFLVTARDDMQLSVSSDAVYNILGRKFPDYLGASVAGNSASSEIIGGFPTPVWFVHRVPVSHGELPKFSRMKFTFNGQSVELRGKSSEKWEDWKKVNAPKNDLLAVWIETYPELSAMYTEKHEAMYTEKHEVKDLEGTETFRGHHYKVLYMDSNWFEAAAICQKIGGHLLIINDAEERNFITTMLPVNEKSYNQVLTSSEFFWTGDISGYTIAFQVVWRGKDDINFSRRGINSIAYGYICEWDY